MKNLAAQLGYVNGNPHLPWVSEVFGWWMQDLFDPKPNARVFDAWSILADEDGLLRPEYQWPPDPDCDFHPNAAGQIALGNAALALILEELGSAVPSIPISEVVMSVNPGDIKPGSGLGPPPENMPWAMPVWNYE